MQLKTIKNNIRNKTNEWLSSITDKELVKDIEENLLVSGGCIANMLLKENINDYDIYLMDKNVAYRIAQYYTKEHNVKIFKGWEKESLLTEFPAELREDEYYSPARKVAISNLNPDQVKLYLPNTAGLRVNEDLPKDSKEYKPIFFSPNAISLSNKIQIVLRFTGEADAIHENYDFMHATNYYTTKNGLVTNKAALESLITKRLIYQGSKYPITSIIRVRKFLKRQWDISAGELLKIMFQISDLNLKDPYVLEEQLIGVDIAYFGKLIEILRGLEPNKLTSSYVNTIIDRIFSETEEEI